MKKKILLLGFFISVFVTLMILPVSAAEIPEGAIGCEACRYTWLQVTSNHCNGRCFCEFKECPTCGENTVLVYCNGWHEYNVGSYVGAQPTQDGQYYLREYTCRYCSKKEELGAYWRGGNCTPSLVKYTVEPTCISWGYDYVICKYGHTDCASTKIRFCAKNYTQPISEHSYSFVSTIAPTCDSMGYDYYECLNCELPKGLNIVPATGHTPTGEGVVTPPTCQEEGFTTYTCSGCNQTYRDNFVSRVDHNYTSETTKRMTCTEDGVRTFTCSYCSHSYTEPIPKTGHVTNTRARFTDSGQFEVYDTCILCYDEFPTEDPCHSCVPYKYSCECGYGWSEDLAWGGLTFSVTVFGRLDYSDSCSDCGSTFSFSLWSAHYYIRTIQDGKIYDICDNCGKQIYIEDYNPDVGGDEDPDCVHDYARTYYPPTCTDRGYYMYVCIKCSSSYIDSYVDALGHDPKSTVVAPTCTAEGYTDNVCQRSGCGEDWVSDRVPPLGHNFINGLCTRCGKNDKCVHTYLESVVPPSCHDFGYTLYTCTQCGDTYMDNYTKQLTHQWRVDGIRNPTCELFGYKELTCTLCGEFDTEDINPYGHKWIPKGSVVRDDKTVDVTSVCSSCGKTKVENLQTAAAQAQSWLLTAFSGLSGGIIDMYNTVANGVEVGGVTAGEVLSGCLVLIIVLGFLGFLWNRGVKK